MNDIRKRDGTGTGNNLRDGTGKNNPDNENVDTKLDLSKLLTDVLKQAKDGASFVSNKSSDITQNDRVYNDDCWHGISVTNKSEKPSIPVVRRISDFKISSVMVEQLSAVYSVKGIKQSSEKADLYAKGSDLFTRLAKETDKRLDSVSVDERMLKRSNIAGKGLVHYFWDDSIENGNDVLERGDFVSEKVHSINWYPSDVNESNVQKQEYNIIAMRKTLSWWKSLAKAQGRTPEEISLISPDEDTSQAVFDEAQVELDGSENLWGYAKYWKQNGKIWGTIVVPGLVVKLPFDTGLNLYPLVGMDWLGLEESAYGLSEITSMKYNQYAINKMLVNALISITKGAHPIMIYNKDLMGLPSGRPNAAFGVKGSVHDAFKYEAPATLSFDVWRMLENLIQWTKEMAGATETALGEVKPENTSALLANQAQASVPIASIVRRYKQYKKDTYNIYCDFYQNKYDMQRLLNTEDKDGNEEALLFTGTEYQDVKFSITLDVGASSQYSEIIVFNLLDKWLQEDRITFIELLERIGDTIPDKQGLIDSRKQEQETMIAETEAFRSQLTPEELAEFDSLPPEQQQQIVQGG